VGGYNLHERQKAEVDGRKEQVRTPADVGDHNWGYHNDEEIGTPVFVGYYFSMSLTYHTHYRSLPVDDVRKRRTPRPYTKRIDFSLMEVSAAITQCLIESTHSV
jgi:hypothetical protein